MAKITVVHPEIVNRLATAKVVVIDKSGTLTQGKPTVADIRGIHVDDRDRLIRFLALAAAVENNSQHPLAKAVVDWSQRRSKTDNHLAQILANLAVTDFAVKTGYGVTGKVNAIPVAVGRPTLMKSLGIDTIFIEPDIVELEQLGYTTIVVAVAGSIEGIIATSDPLKPYAQEVISQLNQLGNKIWLITGDNERTAQVVAREAGITSVLAGVTPEEKPIAINRLREKGNRVVMIGDPLTDGSALKVADIAVGMTDNHSSPSDYLDVLVSEDLRDLVTLFTSPQELLKTAPNSV
ncbi:hypothetical protein A3A66_03275 [Microgenomates group bacterium RIFCSPLOWO2_01_FULL_46_13]|nr:MAG: hypothetical protein A2783_04450 [Microgenomates group bacterium RIFCSPHIGHO2_01_FULL_45_11]OGV95014.1 MAG: hypothetical protein A3A66_03275 [Microgenomates group bacterium RIFCSPLOWO2_01_FULL_46_13]